jgi:hypothetical protein
MSLCLIACSSSNSGPTRPDNIKDNKAPLLVQSFPNSDDVFLSTQSTIVFRFDELLDTSDNRIETGVSLSVVDNVLINSSDSSEVSVDDSALFRARPYSYREEIYTTNTDAGDELDNLSEEINATSLSIRASEASSNFRFSLNSTYRISLAPPLRDLSSIESINPINNEKTTGNFLGQVDYDFTTRDGVWGSSETLLPALNVIGMPKFISSSTNSFAIFKAERAIPNTTTTLIGLYALRYDNALEVWDSNAVVIDDYPISDNPDYDSNVEEVNAYYDAGRGDVSAFDVSVSDNKITVAFLQQPVNGSSPNVFIRLFDEQWKTRLQLDANESNDNLQYVQLAPANMGMYVIWLNEGGSAAEKQVNFDQLVLSEQQGSGLVSLAKALGSDFKLPLELSNISNNTENVKVAGLVDGNALLVSHTEIAGEARVLSYKADVDLLSFKEALDRYNEDLQNCEDEKDADKKEACKENLTKPEFFWTVDELTTPGIPTEADFSLSINESSEGFIAWKQMDSSVFNVYTRRFDGNRWSASELMEFDDRGNAGFINVKTTNDGHALLVWSGDNGDGLFSLKARAYVFDDNEIARNFAGERLLNITLDRDISSGFLIADEEGNANLSILLDDSIVLNYRYRDNSPTGQAWEERSPIDSFFPMFAISSQNIAEDGRMTLLWTELLNGVFTLHSSLFREDTGR